MPKPARLVYWDSCVFLSYINKRPDRQPDLDAVLDEVSNSKGESIIVTSAMAKVEVAFAASEQVGHVLDPQVEEDIDSLWNDSSVVEIVEFSDYVALLARGLIRRALSQGWTLKPFDAVHLASAEFVGAAVFHTYDERLLSHPTIAGCPMSKPFALQPELPLLISGTDVIED